MPLDANLTVAIQPNSRETAREQLRCGSHRTGWAVCHTHPQAERWAASNLRRQGYDAYLPLRTVLRRDRCLPTHSRPVEVPLWTGYLFVAVGSHWTPIAHTLGVARLLMSGAKPHMVPDRAVEALQASEDARRSIHPAGASWAPGMPCCLRKGCAFEGLPAVITAIHINQASIAMIFLGQLRNLSVPIDALVPIGEFQCQDS